MTATGFRSPCADLVRVPVNGEDSGGVHSNNAIAFVYDGFFSNLSPDHTVEEQLESAIRTRFSAELHGSFAIAAWDAKDQSLLLFRDRVGGKPLFYRVDAHGVQFSSRLGELVQPQDSINAGFLSEYLCDEIVSSSDTFYDEIKRVVPGSVIVFRSDVVRSYSTVDFPYGASTGIEEKVGATELNKRIEAALAAASQRSQRVGVAMSGGLDSTSLAAFLSRNGRGVVAITTAYADHAHIDERAAASQVAAYLGLKHIVLDGEQSLPDIQRILALDILDCGPCMNPNVVAFDDVLRQASAAKCFTLMTGIGGDFMQGTRLVYPYLLSRGKLVRAIRLIAKEERRADVFRKYWLAPFVPTLLFGAHAGGRAWPEWLTEEFIANSRVEERLLSFYESTALDRQWRSSSGLARIEASGQFSAALDFALVEQEMLAARHGVSVCHPLLDSGLAFFISSLPPEMRFGPLGPKHILRVALDGVLPDSVRLNRKKTRFDGLLRPRLARILSSGILQDCILERESVSRRGQAIKAATAAASTEMGFMHAWTIVSTELWLRHISQRKGPSSAGRLIRWSP
jgi:asparagine synthase (glutamine-hydrolysing)